MIRPLPPGWTRADSAHDRLVREGRVTDQTVTLGDIAAEGTDELREALAIAAARYMPGPARHTAATELADDLLAGPFAPLLAKVQAVEALADEWAQSPYSVTAAYALRRALGGDRG